ncbi:MAG TPA: ABC transporter permease, partial [Vicinamibacterales bacterium]
YGERAQTLESVAIYEADEVTLTGDGEPERIRVTHATPSLLSVLQVPPAHGRWFASADALPGAAHVGILSHSFWTRRFGRDPAVLGRSLVLGGVPTEIIGIMPASFAFPSTNGDLWMPAQLMRSEGFGLWSYQGVARLRVTATLSDAQRELPTLLVDLPHAFPGDVGALANAESRLTVTVMPLKERIVGGVSRALWSVLAAVGLVFLIACANITNLLLVRSDVREREVAIRQALGAGRLGIIRFFLAESLLLSIAGACLGWAIASTAVSLLVRFGPATLPRLNEIRLDGVAVIYVGVVTTLAAVVFAAAPVWRVRAIAPTLHESGRQTTASRTRHATRHALMGAQVALALVLLIASMLMARSVQSLRHLDPGFDATSSLTFSVALSEQDYPTRETAVAVHQSIMDGLMALPGVRAASATTCLPLSQGCYGNTVRVRGRVLSPGEVPPLALFRAVGDRYFEAMGMRLLRGRAIGRYDIEQRRPVVVIDQTLADQFFPGQDPVGQYLASNRPPKRPGEEPNLTWLEIVGVVSSTPIFALPDLHALPQMYMPMSIAAAGTGKPSLAGPDLGVMYHVVRSAIPATSLVPAVRQVVRGVNAGLPLAQIRSLQEILDGASAQMAFTMLLLTIAAIVALLLGIVGIYGVTSYVVTERTREIGIRLALGAEPHAVARMILRQGGFVAFVGAAVGLGAALSASRSIDDLLYGVNARDPIILAATTICLLGVALAACWFPARRAALLNPLDALRS